MTVAALQPFVWTPGAARTIALFDYAGIAPGTRLPTVLPLRWPDKPAGAVLDYTLDASMLLDPAGDALAAFTAVPSGPSLVAAVVVGGRLILWLGGGVSGTDATIDITLTTASTRFVHRIVRLAVV